MEVSEGTQLTGLFGYLISRAAAAELSNDRSLFPLRHQIDVALGKRPWPRQTRFALDPKAVLLTSPRSEDGTCDTDVQTLGSSDAEAHANLPEEMLRM